MNSLLKFSKIFTPVNKEFVLKQLTESTIFSNYFGDFKLGRAYSSPFRRDKTPSTGFYISKRGSLIFNDLKTGEKLNCFAFVAKLYNISYDDAISKVAEDFGLIKGSVIKYDKTVITNIDNEIKKETLIQFTKKSWEFEEIKYWKQYDISKSEIPKDEVFSVKRLWVNGNEIYLDSLTFAFVINLEDKTYVKIYSPFSKKMKWLSNIPLHIPFGLNTLPYQSKHVIITKSFKDRLILKKFFTDVIATQNESESALNIDTQKILIDNYERRTIIWDADITGVENCKKFNDKGFDYFNTPKEEYELFGIKDPSDYVSYYGIKELEKLLITKKIITDV